MIKNADMPIMPTESLGNTGEPYYDAIPSLGLTKREHFAAMAMQGLLSNSAWLKTVIEGNSDTSEIIKGASYAIADEMLEQPNEQN